MRLTFFVATLVVAVALPACGGGGEEEPIFGPCVVISNDPVITIAAATTSASAASSVPTLFLGQLTYNGLQLEPSLMTSPPASNVRSVGAALECTVPCGFGSSPGSYSFSASAPGMAASSVSVNASYARFKGGCPAFYSGGASISLRLDPTE